MRTQLIAGGCLLALAAAGCGDDTNSSSARDAAGEKGARAAIVEFTDAFVAKHYDDACDVLNERAQRQFKRASCAEVLKLSGGVVKEAQVKQARDAARTLKITVNGDKATVAGVTAGASRKTNLVRQGGRWYIDAAPE